MAGHAPDAVKRQPIKAGGPAATHRALGLSTFGNALVAPRAGPLSSTPDSRRLLHEGPSMLRFQTDRGVRACDGLTRRDFLRAGGLAMGLSLTELALLQKLGAAPTGGEKACIQIFLVGGPSQLDTWDLKPDAPDDIRGPFRPIRTNVPGIDICEHFPRMARLADRFAILRSVHHQEAPIHETGQQLLQTGYLSTSE